ncbi:MAG: beta-ketoacyl synthase chain length factor [Bdellovibrionales bacterium]|nr:beta-ketoacyl synthase chain length factor [Bdellovibrionales bacterium]
MTTLCCEHLLKALPAQTSKQDVSMVLATHFGEVGSTLDFLRTSPSSPTLFQNSLHNSTLGFASVTLGLTSPGMTISCDSETYSSSLLMAETLLNMTPLSLSFLSIPFQNPRKSLY